MADDFEDDLDSILPDREPSGGTRESLDRAVADARSARQDYIDNYDDESYTKFRDVPRDQTPTAKALKAAMEAQKAARSGVEAEAEPEEPEDANAHPEPSQVETRPALMSREALAAVAKLKSGKVLSTAEGQTLAAALERREEEINRGFAQYAGLKPYADHYGAQGVTVKEALDSYVTADQVLARDFMGGMDLMLNRYKLNPQMVAAAFAQKYGLPQGFNAGGGHAPAGMSPQQMAAARELIAITEKQAGEIAQLKAMVSSGAKKADQQRQHQAAEKARKASGSIRGDPTHGVPARPDKPAGSTREALYDAISKQGVRVS